MDRNSLLMNGIRVLGCTLWSKIPKEGIKSCEAGLNDFRRIFVDDQQGQSVQFTPEICSMIFEEEFTWLQQEVMASKERNELVVILTHHTPSFWGTSHPSYGGDPQLVPGDDGNRWMNCCFSTNLEEFIQLNPHIKLWGFGHTHFNNDFLLHQTRIVSNQRGYRFGPNEFYNPAFVVHVS